jgi:hypothetical protein
MGRINTYRRCVSNGSGADLRGVHPELYPLVDALDAG